jgi:tape measure domain-containing protein
MAGSRSIGGIFATLSLKDAQFRKGLSSASAGLEKFGKASMAAGAAGVAAIGALSVAGMVGFVKSSSKAAATIEDLTIQFGVLTSSASKAQQLIKAFREEEKKSALSTEDYGEGAKKLLANNVAYEKVIPTLKMLADVSLGNSERFGRLSLAFGQISAKGKLAGQELNQLAESGFNPLQQMAEKTGESYESLFKKMEGREISVQDVTNALKDATSEGGRFYKAIDKGSAGTNAKINQTKAAITQLQVAFGTGFNDGLKNALDAISKFLPQMEDKFKTAGSFVGMAITDAVSGDGAKFTLIGEYIGTAIAEGMKIGVKKAGGGVMGFMEDFVLQRLEVLDIGRFYMMDSIKNDLLDQAIAEKDPQKRKELQASAARISSQPNNFREQYDLGKAYQDKQNQGKAAAEFAKGMKGITDRIAEEMKKNAPIPFMGPPKPESTSAASQIIAPTIELPSGSVEIPPMPERKIDDYQRRGLSLSKTPGAVQDKVLKVQEQIRDILKNAQIQGKELVWA